MAVDDILDLDPNEQVLLDVRRYPIGLYIIYGLGIAAVFAVLVALYLAVSSDLDVSSSILGIGAGLAVALIAVFTYIGGVVYNGNRLVVTNENIIQVLQFSLLNRQVSQLNLAKIQDVSADQAGLLQTILGYGTIEIETAGEAANFRFPYVSDPNQVAKQIIEAHEDYIRRHPAGHNTYRI